MRLLNVHDLTFQTFTAPNIPGYVVASHRWSIASEATIKDITKRRNTHKSGYRKVQGYATYIEKNVPDIDWLWIDTCCVNQDSSLEVSEAVNSMFRWYSDAELCIAFLADVVTAQGLHEFRRSSWFRRGWTLQELIAPRNIVFLTEDWQVVGHKGDSAGGLSCVTLPLGPSLETVLSEITGIPEEVLRNGWRSNVVDPDEVFRWTHNRETTKEEDLSYCLFGLFEVSLPIIYGEGSVKARERLLAEVSKSSATASQRLAEAPLAPVFTVPFLRDRDFVHRTELDELERKVSLAGERVALVGLGGVGKSQLAIEYCYRLRERSPDIWILWVHASSKGRFDESMRKLADDVRVAGRGDANAIEILELVRSWLCDVRNGRWFLVLDNLDDADFLFGPLDPDENKSGGLRTGTSTCVRFDFLPISAHGSIIVTSRNRAAAMRLVDDYDTIDVQVMDRKQAVTLLDKKFQQREDTVMLEALATALECMPLALAQAAAYIKRRAPRNSVAQYLDELKKGGQSTTDLLNKPEQVPRRDREASNAVMSTWRISFEYIRSSRPSAADLLSLMSFFDHQSIPEMLLQPCGTIYDTKKRSLGCRLHIEDSQVPREGSDFSDEEAFENDILALRDFNFISIAPGGATFEMHRLVSLAAQKWLALNNQYHQWVERSIHNMCIAHPTGEHENWQKCRVLYPHVRLMLSFEPESQASCLEWAKIMYMAAWYTQWRGSPREAEVLATMSRNEYQRLLGDQHPNTLVVERRLGEIFRGQGRYGEAEEWSRRAMEGFEKVLGKDHRDTLTSVSILAKLLQSQGRYKEAEELQRRALEGREMVLGKEHRDTSTSASNLAIALQSQGKVEEAEELHRRALEAFERVLGKEHPNTLTSASGLATVLRNQGRYKEAEEVSLRVLEGHEKVLGKEHRETLTSVSILVTVLQYQGRYKEAEGLGQRALEGREKVLGKEHHDTLTSVSDLARVLQSQGRLKEAEELHRRALEGHERVLGKQHPDTSTCVRILAKMLRNQGRYKEAEELGQRALLWTLASCRGQQKKHGTALKMCEQADISSLQPNTDTTSVTSSERAQDGHIDEAPPSFPPQIATSTNSTEIQPISQQSSVKGTHGTTLPHPRASITPYSPRTPDPFPGDSNTAPLSPPAAPPPPLPPHRKPLSPAEAANEPANSSLTGPTPRWRSQTPLPSLHRPSR